MDESSVAGQCIDGLLCCGQMRPLFLQPFHDDLKIMHRSGQTVDPCDDQRFTFADKIQYRVQLHAVFQIATAFLFGADHAAASNFQSLNLGLKVLISGRGSRVADLDVGSVH